MRSRSEQKAHGDCEHILEALQELCASHHELVQIASALRSAWTTKAAGRTEDLPKLMTVPEAGEKLFRRSPRAMYQLIRRGHVPGVVRSGESRILIDRDVALEASRLAR